jgi:2-polyprenyl-3-methyl-5-hydroxy-6-metoxy-1,4-benzoquinol methylase
MKEHYFANHYAHINKIDSNSEESIKNWLRVSLKGYETELGPYLENISQKRFLELGCGVGGTLNYLMSKNVKEAVGVDHSADQLMICRKYVTTNVFQTDVIDYLKQTSDTYDYIIALDLIEHLPKNNIIEFCTLLYRVLNTGGKIILRTPNMGSLFGLRSRYIDFTHEVGFTEESINQVLREGGFSKISINNSYIGKRRLMCIRLFQRTLEKLYNITFPKIVTQNLMIEAQK